VVPCCTVCTFSFSNAFFFLLENIFPECPDPLRFKQGQVTVNQSVSFSFDPSSLLCVTCESGHTIIDNKPVTVFFSDQNFIANLEGKNGYCLIIVKMEDASLSELFELSKELFANVKFPEGSAFMYGSASYLSRAGCGMYAADWTSIVTHAEKVWYGVRVCPLILLILTSCPGSLARELSEFAAWLSIVYEGNPLGLQATWGAVVSATEKLSVGGTALPTMDAYKVAVPKTLDETSMLSSMTFCSMSSRPVTLMGLPKDTLDELIGSLLDTVHRYFQTCDSPENYLVRGPSFNG
jgi:hypothetical protein